MKIDAIVACGPIGDVYLKLLLDNIAKTVTTHEIKFIVAQHKCNVSAFKGHPQVKQIIEMPDNIPDSRHSASMAHGTSMNACVPLVETELTLLIDYDVALMTRGWDTCLIKEFDNGELGLIGSEYSDAARGCKKYLLYPSLIFSVVRTSLLRQHGIDFRPHPQTIIIRSQVDEKLYARSIGTEVHRDTGWELGTKLRGANVNAKILRYVGDAKDANGQYVGQEFANELIKINHLKSGSIQKQSQIDAWSQYINTHLT